MTPMRYDDYMVGVQENRKHKLLLDSENKTYGGPGGDIPETIVPTNAECDGRPYSIAFPLAPYQVAIFVY